MSENIQLTHLRKQERTPWNTWTISPPEPLPDLAQAGPFEIHNWIVLTTQFFHLTLINSSLPKLELPKEANSWAHLSHICMNIMHWMLRSFELQKSFLASLTTTLTTTLTTEHNGVTERLSSPAIDLKHCWFWKVTNFYRSHKWLLHPLQCTISIYWVPEPILSPVRGT